MLSVLYNLQMRWTSHKLWWQSFLVSIFFGVSSRTKRPCYLGLVVTREEYEVTAARISVRAIAMALSSQALQLVASPTPARVSYICASK